MPAREGSGLGGPRALIRQELPDLLGGWRGNGPGNGLQACTTAMPEMPAQAWASVKLAQTRDTCSVEHAVASVTHAPMRTSCVASEPAARGKRSSANVAGPWFGRGGSVGPGIQGGLCRRRGRWHGKKLYRPIASCRGRAQHVLNDAAPCLRVLPYERNPGVWLLAWGGEFGHF